MKKISLGTVEGISSWGGYVTGFGSFLYTTWYQGVTEGGSSGSPLFNGAQQVVGQLKGGASLFARTRGPRLLRAVLTLRFPYVNNGSTHRPIVECGCFVSSDGQRIGDMDRHGRGRDVPLHVSVLAVRRSRVVDGARLGFLKHVDVDPATPGSYLVQVWLRSADRWPSTTLAPGSRVGITPSRADGHLRNAKPHWGGRRDASDVERHRRLRRQTVHVSVLGLRRDRVASGPDWSPSSAWTWTPSAPGTYSFQVSVRNAGSSARLDAFRSFGPYVATGPPALSVSSLTADHAAPVPAGTSVTWTAGASGGTGRYTYQFWVFNGTTWNIGQDWSASPTWTWIPSALGNYMFQVWVRMRVCGELRCLPECRPLHGREPDGPDGDTARSLPHVPSPASYSSDMDGISRGRNGTVHIPVLGVQRRDVERRAGVERIADLDVDTARTRDLCSRCGFAMRGLRELRCLPERRPGHHRRCRTAGRDLCDSNPDGVGGRRAGHHYSTGHRRHRPLHVPVLGV